MTGDGIRHGGNAPIGADLRDNGAVERSLETQVDQAVEAWLRCGPAKAWVTTVGGRVLVEPSTAATISATTIRRALAAGQVPADLPPAVLAYIRQHRLYTDPGASPPE